MKTKFTPGPWEVDKRASLRVAKNNITICSCGASQNGDNLEEQQANAKLCAAAPDMLDCLNEMTNYIHGIDSNQMVVLRIPQELSEKIGKTLNKILI